MKNFILRTHEDDVAFSEKFDYELELLPSVMNFEGDRAFEFVLIYVYDSAVFKASTKRHTEGWGSGRLLNHIRSQVHAFSRLNKQVRQSLRWAMKLKKQRGGIDLIDFSYAGIFYFLVKLPNESNNVETC
jgi:hypothetical protein